MCYALLLFRSEKNLIFLYKISINFIKNFIIFQKKNVVNSINFSEHSAIAIYGIIIKYTKNVEYKKHKMK